MKINTILALFLLSSSCIYAQSNDVKITWGEHIPIPKGQKPVGFLGNKDIGYLQLSENSGKSFSLNKISPDLKNQGSDLVEIGDMKKTFLEKVVNLGNKAFLMISAQTKDKTGDCLFAQEVDVKGGKFIGTPQLLIETGGELEGRLQAVFPMGFKTVDKFTFSEDPSSGNFLVSYELKESKSNPSPVPNYAMFDQNLKKQWSFENRGSGSLRYGDIYFVNGHIYGVSVSKYGGLSPDLVISNLVEGEKKITTSRAQIPNVLVSDLVTQKISDTKIMVGGYYTPVAKTNMVAGYFTAIADLENSSIDGLKKFEFSDKLINDFESDRTKRKLEKSIEKGAGKGIPYLLPRQIIKKSDGGFYLIGEQYYIKRVETSKSIRHYYNYHDAVISSVNAAGEEEFTLKVPKQQVFVDSEYGSGIGCYEHKNNLYLFYLDNSVNKNLAEDGVPVQFREFSDGAFVAIKISSNGKMSRHFLFDMKDENKTILPDGIDQIDNGVLLSSGRRSQIISGKINTPAMIRLN